MKEIGKGKYGTTYQACCKDDCQYTLKWEYPKEFPDDNSIELQIQYQNKAAERNLALPVMERWDCSSDNAHGFVMPTLDHTLYYELAHSTPKQLDQAKEIYAGQIKMVLIVLQTVIPEEMIDTIRHSIDHVMVNATYLSDLDKMYKYITDICHKLNISSLLPSFPPTLLKDTFVDRQRKRFALFKVHNLLRGFEEIGMVHNDAHLGNFMKKGDRYYAIDFGRAYMDEDSYGTDSGYLYEYLEKLVNEHIHYQVGMDLSYLLSITYDACIDLSTADAIPRTKDMKEIERAHQVEQHHFSSMNTVIGDKFDKEGRKRKSKRKGNASPFLFRRKK